MPHLEPTYLRYIYDGLIKGSLHPENAAELPDGLIGLYEEAFDERTSVIQRQKLLKRFAIWALLKKEVSAAFVAEVLDEPEEVILNFIANYSAWFNSPESGKYQLYHERLKVFLLQKLSEKEIHDLNEKLISRLEQAIEEQKADEFELYGLEFLGYHLIIETTLTKSFDDFVNNCLNTNFIDRQINVSNAFDWSKEAIKHALKLAAFNEAKNIVFQLSKSLVILNAKEKEGLGEIEKLLDVGDDALVLTRLNSIIDGTKENYTTSYAFQILSIAYLMDNFLSNNIEKRVQLFIGNIENNIPDDPKVVDQSLLIPEHITIKLLVELKNIGLKPDFILKRNSSINFSAKNLITYNFKELKYLHVLVRTYYHDNEIDFLVCAANSVIHQNKNADYFFKNIEDKLEKNRRQKDSFLSDSSYDYYGFDLIPEEIIEKTKNRRIINYCCENYLSYGINKYSKKLYKEKFKIKEKDDLNDFFPFPEINLNKLFELDELKEISKKLADTYIKDNERSTTDENKNLQERVIACLVNDYDFDLKKLKRILEKYELIRFSSIINPYRTHEIYWGKTFGLSRSKIIHPKMNQTNIYFIKEKVNDEGIELDCYLNICSFFLNKDNDEEKLNNILISNLRQIEEYDKKSHRNFETFEIIQFLFFQGFNLKLVLELIKSSKFKGTAIDLYRYLICYYFVENDLEKATLILELLNDLENNTKCSILTYDFLDFFQTKNVKISLEKVHFDFLNNLLAIKNLDSENEKFTQFKLIALMSINGNGIELYGLQNLDKLVIEKLSEFNSSLWKYIAIKYYCEKSNNDITKILSLYQDYGLKNIKVKSDDINSFRLQYNLPNYKTISSKIMKKKVALHCIKNNLTDYFLSNELHKERLFSDGELINFFSNYLNQKNIQIFNSLIESLADASLPFGQNFNLLIYKNELYYFLRLNSLDTSRISFACHDEVVESGLYPSEKIAIKAIKCMGDVNSLEILNECIAELDDIEDDIVNWETGEIIDGSEEKVKSLYFIVCNLWKIGEKKLARNHLKTAFDFYNKMEYETEKKTWIKKLDYLAMYILSKKDLEIYLKEKIQIHKSLTVEIIDSIFKNNFSNLINYIFTKGRIGRSVMEHMVNAYVKFHSLEKAFLYVKQIKNQVHANAWKNIVVEKVYSIGNDFDGTVAFDKYDLVYNSVESTKALEQMLKYELFSELSSESSIKQITSKYDGYLNEDEVKQLVKNISNA